jgi:hypothetical protein
VHHRVGGNRSCLRRSGYKRQAHQYTEEQINAKNSHNNRSRVYKNPR